MRGNGFSSCEKGLQPKMSLIYKLKSHKIKVGLDGTTDKMFLSLFSKFEIGVRILLDRIFTQNV